MTRLTMTIRPIFSTPNKSGAMHFKMLPKYDADTKNKKVKNQLIYISNIDLIKTSSITP